MNESCAEVAQDGVLDVLGETSLFVGEESGVLSVFNIVRMESVESRICEV